MNNENKLSAKVENKSSMSYKGDVKITLVKDDKEIRHVKVHNTGTLNLFKSICNHLAGNTTLAMPNYVHAYYWNTSETGEEAMYDNSSCVANVPKSSSSVYLEESTSDADCYAYVVYSFLIPYTQVFNNINLLVLYPTSGFNKSGDLTHDPMAYIVLDEPIDIETNGKMNIRVEWTMTVKNG